LGNFREGKKGKREKRGVSASKELIDSTVAKEIEAEEGGRPVPLSTSIRRLAKGGGRERKRRKRQEWPVNSRGKEKTDTLHDGV